MSEREKTHTFMHHRFCTLIYVPAPPRLCEKTIAIPSRRTCICMAQRGCTQFHVLVAMSCMHAHAQARTHARTHTHCSRSGGVCCQQRGGSLIWSSPNQQHVDLAIDGVVVNQRCGILGGRLLHPFQPLSDLMQPAINFVELHRPSYSSEITQTPLMAHSLISS